MNKENIIKKLRNSEKELKERGVDKIGLFGSYAKQKQKKNSDIDFIVKFEYKSFENYMGLLFLLRKIFKKKIDLVIEESIKPELNYVKKEAIYVKI